MDNYTLLEKYRKKLSIYFTFFILFSVWLTQLFFLVLQYYSDNLSLEDRLNKRLIGVENIIQNHEIYLSKLNNDDTTLQKVLLKTLENTIVYDFCNSGTCEDILVDNIGSISNKVIDTEKKFINIGNYKYLKETFTYEYIDYKIIIKNYNEYSLNIFINKFLYFVIFSLPFIFLFYFIGYFFVGKNLKPIKQTISGLEDFTSNINHEIKTPLSEIVSTLLLAKKIRNYDEAIDQSIDSSKKITKILDSMLGMINLIDSTYKKQRVDIIKELKSIIKSCSKSIDEKNIIIKTDLKNNSYFLKINKEHLDICIRNILQNAVKYSYEKGVIDIKFLDGKLEIIDYGIGIKKENLKSIFDRYFRENYIKEKGYGIGLSLVKKIVDINGWNIFIESRKRKNSDGLKGTKVIILFNN